MQKKRIRFGLLVSVVMCGGLLAAAALAQNSVEYRSPFPDAVANNLRVIYTVGQAYGNRANVFSKVGDSITVNYAFLHPFGWRTYDLGIYAYLQPVIDYFNYAIVGDRQTSFTHTSHAAGVGWAAWSVLEPQLAVPDPACLPGEKPLECEYRLTRPAYALIMFGTNDSSYRTPQEFRWDLERILRLSLDWGVIPIFSTIPMRPEIPETIYAYNDQIRDLTTSYNLPLWDYFSAMNALPNYGLAWDNLHPSSSPLDDSPQYAGVFTPDNLQYGYTMRNLTALQILNDVWRTVEQPNQQ